MTDPVQSQRRPYGVACTICRRAKIKCVSTGSVPNRCDRCARLQKDCIFESHRRGLWRRERNASRPESQVQPVPPLAVAPSGREGDSGLRQASASSTSSGSHGVSGSLCLLDEGQTTLSSQGDYTSFNASFSPQSFIMHTQDTRGLCLHTALDPNRIILGDGDGNGDPNGDGESIDAPPVVHEITQGREMGDPIDLNLISRPSAQSLYEGFYKHFNCLVGLLDSDLYTFSYTRQRSSLLFTSILTISSRVFRPESYPILREHAESLLGKVLLACDSAVENIWSIICMYYWKDVGDTRGYTLVGFALRMASSAEWNKTGRHCACDRSEASKLHESELEVRQRRDKDRVWLALGNIDRTSSYFTDRPLFLAPIDRESASRSWLTLDNWTYPLGDGKAVGGSELTRIAQPAYDIMMKSRKQASGSELADNDIFKAAIKELNKGLAEWGEYWPTVFTKFPSSEPWQVPLIQFFRDYMRLSFNSVLLHRILAANDNNALHEDAVETILVCYSSALGVLKQSISLGRLDVLYYLWDTAHLMTAYAAMMLLKLMKQAERVPGVSLEEGFKVLSEASAIHASAADSLGSCYESLDPAKPLLPCPLNAQARLLSAIVFRVQSEFRLRGPYISVANDDFVSRASSTQSQSRPADPGLSPGNYRDNSPPSNEMALAGPVGSYYSTSLHNTNTHTQPSISQITEDMFFSLDSGFMDSRFTDVGLLAWDEPGIFIDPR